MLKTILLYIFILVLLGCKSTNELPDYYGQTIPDSSAQIFAPDLISKVGRLEQGISFTPDMRELAFGILNNDQISGVIYYADMVDDKWTEPIEFAPLKDKSAYLPYFSPDGKYLLYAQSKPEVFDGYTTDIYNIEKENGKWNIPKKMQKPISSASREANACMTKSGDIYFSSNRNCIGKENCFTADLFYSKYVNNKYETANEIPELASLNDEESVFISPDEEYILFCRYKDNVTFVDLYISYLDSNKNWTEPEILDSSINSKNWDRRPFVSHDKKALFFTRLQIEGNGITESDIYWVNTSKVFKPFVYNPITAPILKVGEKFNLPIPNNYFKDIDDAQLRLSINQDEFEWLEFNPEKMNLSGVPKKAGYFELIFNAVDQYSNMAEDKIKITVQK